ncbi:MFS transporter [Paenibacillus aquistagni]|uniref:MFS transporter n=1 Tax=Paenibacillus aquistagni TaxID=1852522 RepID=UPI001F0F22E5|nr:MFS transporter [Paenibacillus aquistagni]
MQSRFNNNMPLYILMLNMFIALMGIGIIIPILPEYLKYFDVGGSTAGYLVATFGVAQFLLSPIGGRWSDRYGRKIMIVVGLILTGMSHLFSALTETVWLLYVARLFGGIGTGLMIPSIMAYVADITTVETRAKGMGLLSAAMNLGIAIGPGIGGMLASYGIRAPFFVAFGLGMIGMLLSLFILPETLTAEKKAEMGAVQAPKVSMLMQLRQSVSAPYFVLLILIFIMSFGLMNYETVFPLFAADRYGFTAKEISVLITAGALIGVFTQAWLIERLVGRFGEQKVIRYTMIGAALSMIMLLMSGQFWYVLAMSICFFTFVSLMRPAMNTLLSKMASANEQGFVAGLNNTYNSLGSIFGPIFAGMLFDVHLNLPYTFGAAVLMVGMVISIVWAKRQADLQPGTPMN